jgi:hypothetical protein
MRPALTSETSFSDHSLFDKQERTAIAQALTAAALSSGAIVSSGTTTASLPAQNSAKVSLQDLFIPVIVGSTFDEAYEPARIALEKLIKSEDFSLAIKLQAYPASARIGVDAKETFFAIVEDGRDEIPIAKDDETNMLAAFAKNTGGYIYSGNVVSIEQWLAFEGLNLPQTLGEIKQLISYLNFELPAAPASGNYHELANAEADSPFHLSSSARDTIKEVIQDATQGTTSLLQKVTYAGFKLTPAAQKREHADKILTGILRSDSARSIGQKLHERLAWHLETADESVRNRQLSELMVAALIVSMATPQDHLPLAGYDPYQPSNATRHAAQVREDLEQHLVAQGMIDSGNSPLAAHLLLAGSAPEFLIPDIPAELTLEKPGWVVIAQAVALIEQASPGSSRLMTFAQIKAFADLPPMSQEQDELHAAAGFIPAINWAVLNGVIEYRAEKDYDNATLVKAAEHFERYMEALSQSETGLSTAPPERKKVALEALKKVMPDGSYLEQKAFYIKYLDSFKDRSWLEALKAGSPVSIFSELYDLLVSTTDHSEFATNKLLRLRFSVLDLYLSGDLIEKGTLTQRFEQKSAFKPPAGAFNRLSELPSPGLLFDRAFDTYYQGVREGLSSIIRMAIANMPEDDRRALTNSNVTLYTVRKEVNPLNPQEETQFARDEAIGRYGIILCCKSGETLRAYELFTLRGLCRERPELAALLRSSEIIHSRPTISFTGSKYDFQQKNKALEWPLDFAAYREGSEPREGETSSVVVEKLWHLYPDATDFRPVSLFFSRQTNAIAECILNNHPVASRDELYASLNVPTELEEWRTSKEAVERLAINVIVPFKQCIEDISSGRTDRVSEGIGGCVLDGLSVLGLLIGLGSTAASILAKTGSTTLKILKISKAVARAALSLVNPLDGVPTLLRKGLRLTLRGLLFVGENSLTAVSSATKQLKKLSGSVQSNELIKAVQSSDAKIGTWQRSDDINELVEIAAHQRNGGWHACHHKTGSPWGPRLKHFKLFDFSPLRRLINRFKPQSYTKIYIKKAIPVAKSKLDNSLHLLGDADSELDVRRVLKCLFGTDSDEAIAHLAQKLRVMRKDLDAFTMSNISFKRTNVNAVAALHVPDYKRWKRAVTNKTLAKESIKRFIKVYPDHLDELYRAAKYDESRVADVLIHEMSHGGPGTFDLYYGKSLNRVEFDIASLIDLARNPRMADPSFSNPHRLVDRSKFTNLDEFASARASLPPLIQKHPAFYNADSYEVAVSLLHQIKSDPHGFAVNMTTIETALANPALNEFIDSLEINLGRSFE